MKTNIIPDSDSDSELGVRSSFYELKYTSLMHHAIIYKQYNQKDQKDHIDKFVKRVIGEIENINVKYKSFDRDRFVAMFNRTYNKRGVGSLIDSFILYHIFIICFNRCCKDSKIIKTKHQVVCGHVKVDACGYVKVKESKNRVYGQSILSSFPISRLSLENGMILSATVASYIITRANFE